MKRVIPAILSGLLLSCQGPAAVLAREAMMKDSGQSALERPGGYHLVNMKRDTKETRRPSIFSDDPGGAAIRADPCAPEIAARPNPPSSGNSLSTVQSVNLPLACTLQVTAARPPEIL